MRNPKNNNDLIAFVICEAIILWLLRNINLAPLRVQDTTLLCSWLRTAVKAAHGVAHNGGGPGVEAVCSVDV